MPLRIGSERVASLKLGYGGKCLRVGVGITGEVSRCLTWVRPNGMMGEDSGIIGGLLWCMVGGVGGVEDVGGTEDVAGSTI